MSNKRTKPSTLILLAAIAATIPLIALGARGIIARASYPDVAPAASRTFTGILPLATQERGDLTALVFVVRPFGFTPNDITVAAGRYLIVLENRSGRRDLTFRIERENGERLHEGRSERLDWKRQFDLQPGNYIVSEISHPEWSCVIRVTSR